MDGQGTQVRDEIIQRIDTAARTLYSARIDAAKANGELNAITAAFNTEHAHIIQTVAMTRAMVKAAELELRELTIAAYQMDDREKKDKKPHPSVGVRVSPGRVTYQYPDDAAMAWARENPVALTYDRGILEASLSALPAERRPGWFTEHHSLDAVSATIVEDLSKVYPDGVRPDQGDGDLEDTIGSAHSLADAADVRELAAELYAS